MHANRTKVEKE